YERAGGRYYPKAQVCVPFTPATGPRLLLGDTADADTQRILGEAIVSVAGQLGLSGLHLTFPEKAEFDALGELDAFEQRLGLQYHWHNADYASFDDFLGALNSRKRKAIRKERREVAALDIDIRTLSGSEMTEALWDAFFDFYLNTSDRKWGQAYLTRRFFSLLSERCAENVVMVMAFEGGQPVAGALNFRGGDTLYGRNWGCLEDHKFLHFEACYYRAIDYAIEHGLTRVEAGAQGQHKVQRGYLATPTYSLHWIADPALQRPVANFVRQEREQVEHQIEAMRVHDNPYRKAEI
ncbi:MAG: GNAT family N-acetyltransferase, partial [Alphaproteobacteria bacterium]